MRKKPPASKIPLSKGMDHGRIVTIPEQDQCLDTDQLNQLEQSFRQWAESSPRADVGLSRRRILIIFLLIRYTAAKLNEVLALNPFTDINAQRSSVFYRDTDMNEAPREVRISKTLSHEILAALKDPAFQNILKNLFQVDPGFVRRKFYERAQTCGFSKRLGGPEMIRKARAVELMQQNMPLPAVQMMLGHSTPNLTSAYVSFSADEIQQMTSLFMERESSRKTSARNSFFGKIQQIQKGDIQTRITLLTIGGHLVTTVITNDSVNRLGLKQGRMITAEVKAPWILLHKGEKEPISSAENRFKGNITRILRGAINTEFTVHISDGMAICAIVSTESARQMNLKEQSLVWTIFNSFAVVLHVE